MEAKWDHCFAGWATHRAHSVSAATMTLLGTPLYNEAKKRFMGGACERVAFQLLDMAMASVNPKL